MGNKETKRALGKKSRDLASDNRAKIYLSIMTKPMRFDEIVDKTHLSRSTVNNHLHNLVNEGFLEKETQDGRLVYKITLNRERISEELKKDMFISLFTAAAHFFPTLEAKVNAMLEEFANDVFMLIHEGTVSGVKKRNITQEVFNVLIDEAKKGEMLYAFKESTIQKLSKKYPEAMKELLESEKRDES